MTQLQTADASLVDIDNPLPVRVGGRLRVATLVVPGVVAGAAYSTGEAVGTRMEFAGLVDEGVWTGTLLAARLLDMDNEKLACDLVLFNDTFIASADNATFDPSDADANACFGVVGMAGGDFTGFSDWAIGFRANLNIPLFLPNGVLFAQMVTRGAPNLTAATDYRWTLFCQPD